MRFRTRWTSAIRLAASIVLIIGMVTACASGGSGGKGGQPNNGVEPGPTLTGNYLAARHAQEAREQSKAVQYLLAALEKAPDDPVLLSRAYVALILDGHVKEATALARRVKDMEGSATLAPIVVAIDDLKAGRFAEVAHLDALSNGPLGAFLRPIFKAWALYGLGRRDEALASLKPLSEAQRFAGLYHLHAALINDAAGTEAAAVRHADAAVSGKVVASPRAIELLGGIYARAGRQDQALALYQTYLAEHQEAVVLQESLARLKAGGASIREIDRAADGAAEALLDGAAALTRQNARETALVLGQLGLYLRPNFPELQVLVASLLESIGRLEDANRVYASVDAGSPFAWGARLAIAENLDEMEKTKEAERHLQAMAREKPDNPEPLIELGDMLRKHERFEEAVDAYDRAAARIGTLEPRHWRLLYARGIALERAKQWPRAEQDFLTALTFEPDQPLVLNYLGYSWVEQRRNLDQALTMIRKAVELRPNDGYIVDSLGWVYYKLGRYEESVVELERAAELRPEDPVINDHLGDAYWVVGRQREARYQWQAALELNPEPDLKAAIEAKLQRGLITEASAAAE